MMVVIIENQKAFVLGLLTLILVSVALFTPKVFKTVPAVRLSMVLFFIGINAAVLLMIGGIHESKNLSGTGFGIGIASWAIIILLLILAIVDTIHGISVTEKGIIVYLDNFLRTSDPYYLLSLINELISIDTYKTDILMDVIQICMLGGCTTLGSVSFGMILKTKI